MDRRRELANGQVQQETVFAITSRPADALSELALGAALRAHWGIENGVHYRRDFTYDEDSTTQALGISETASGTGGLSPAYVSVPTMGYPPLEKTISRTQVNNEGVLVTLADADLDLYANPVILPTITVPLALPDSQGGTDPTQIGFANFNLGDDLLWRIDPLSGGGLNVSPRFPNGMSFEWRIVKWLCQVPDSGLPVLVFTLALPPTTVSPPPAPPLA